MQNSQGQPPFVHLEDVIEKKLLDHRRLFLCDAIDNESVKAAVRKLWYMQLCDAKAPITIIIHSPGGSVDAGMGLWDQIKALNLPINTLVTGMAASMGSVLSLVASKGRRYAMNNSRIMMHQPLISGVVRGQASDLEIHAREIIKTKTRLVQIYSAATGQTPEVIERALDRDNWMSAQEAKEFGLIDHIISNLDEMSSGA